MSDGKLKGDIFMKFTRPVIDSHTHLYDWYGKDGRDFFTLFDELEENTGVKAMCLNSLTTPNYGGVDNNIMTAFYKLHNPSAYAKAGIVYPSFPAVAPFPCGMDSLTQYKELMEIGFDGFKILFKPDTQKLLGLPMNDPYYYDFFSEAEKNGTHITWHVADPDFFWNVERDSSWCYTDGTYLSFREMFEQVFDILDRYPKLNATFAHFLFLSEHTDVLEYIFDKYPNVCIDVTPGTEMYVNFDKNPDFYRDFLEKHADRIIFGTDAELPDNPGSEQLVKSVYTFLTSDETVNIWGFDVKGLKLSDEACEKLLYTNFLQKCGEKPREINKAALKKYAQKYEHLIKKELHREKISEFIEKL